MRGLSQSSSSWGSHLALSALPAIFVACPALSTNKPCYSKPLPTVMPPSSSSRHSQAWFIPHSSKFLEMVWSAPPGLFSISKAPFCLRAFGPMIFLPGSVFTCPAPFHLSNLKCHLFIWPSPTPPFKISHLFYFVSEPCLFVLSTYYAIELFLFICLLGFCVLAPLECKLQEARGCELSNPHTWGLTLGTCTQSFMERTDN